MRSLQCSPSAAASRAFMVKLLQVYHTKEPVTKQRLHGMHAQLCKWAQLFSSVQFSCSVVSNSLQPHGLQHSRPPCPSPAPRAGSNSCPLSQWCHPTISSSVVPSPPAFSLSQHQGLFQWVSSSHQVVKVLEIPLQLQSFQWIFRTDSL